MKEIGTKINGKEATSKNLRIVKEQWLDTLYYKKVKLEKYIEKHNRDKHNIMFQRGQIGFFWTLEAVEKREGEMPEMQRFVQFWGGTWGQNEPTLKWTVQESKSCEWICHHWQEYEERNCYTKKLDNTRNRWHPKLLAEEIRTCTESIKEGIHRPARGYSDDSWVVTVRKNCSASKNEKC